MLCPSLLPGESKESNAFCFSHLLCIIMESEMARFVRDREAHREVSDESILSEPLPGRTPNLVDWPGRPFPSPVCHHLPRAGLRSPEVWAADVGVITEQRRLSRMIQGPQEGEPNALDPRTHTNAKCKCWPRANREFSPSM